MKASIRPARAADIATIFAVRTAVKENPLSLAQLTEMGITPEAVLEMLTLSACAWVADIDSITAGFTMIDPEQGSVFALFILPEYEGLGLGTQLMVQAETALFERHSILSLETDSHSRAAEFYQRRGWRAVAQLSDSDKRYQKQRP